MDTLFPGSIKKVEDQWLNLLYLYIKQLFSGHWIPSHDETHAFRAWIHAKELLNAMHGTGIEITRSMIEQVILIIFFHDAGMIKDAGPDHGKISAEMARTFLKNHQWPQDQKLDAVIEAITRHDNKTYRYKPENGDKDQAIVFSIVGAADDLDAFGRIGVYRFLEIYLVRDVPGGTLPGKVITSLDHRLEHLERNFGALQLVTQKHHKRYFLTRSFFEDLLLETASEKGYASLVMEVVRQMVKMRKYKPGDTKRGYFDRVKDPDALAFFRGLQDEFHTMHKNLPESAERA